ncbi:MAG TPA: hypothetical protein VEO37_08400 [Thermoanaerobaculia bacterium]|nr:hypothetical protein [Thermoanaerobaculia bacterium]
MQLGFRLFRALIGSPAYPPTSPATVVIPRREPRKPHERVGHVFVEPSGGPPVEEIEKAIRTEAARLGANAAVIVFDRTRRVGRVYQGPWWDRTAYPIYGRKIIAVAIRYRGERETRDENRRFRLLGTCAFRRTGSRLAQRGSTASLVPPALTLPRRAPARRFRLLGTCAFGAPARGSPKGARPRAWSLARSRSRGARLLPSGRLRAPRAFVSGSAD